MDNSSTAWIFGKNVATNTFGALWQFILVLVGTRAVIDLIGTDAFGLLALVGGVSGYFVYIDIGIGDTIVKKISEAQDSEEKSRVASTLFATSIFFGFFFSLLILVFAWYGIDLLFTFPPELMESLKNIFIIIAAGLIILYPLNVYNKGFVAQNRFDIYNILRIFYQTIILGALLIALKRWNSAEAAVAVITVGGIAWRAHSMALFLKHFPEIRVNLKLFDRKTMKDTMRFKSYSFTAQAAGQTINQCDVYVLGIMLNPASVALYSVANVIAIKIFEVSGVIGAVLLPTLSGLYGEKRNSEIKNIFVLGTVHSLALLIPVAVFFFVYADDMLRLWVGEDFASAAPILQWLSVAWLLGAVSTVPRLVTQAVDKPEIPAKLAVGIATANVALDFIMVATVGMIGVVYATLACQAIGLLLLVYFAGRNINAGLFSLFSGLLKTAFAGLIFVPVYFISIPSFLFPVKLLLHTTLFFAAYYFAVINAENRGSIRHAVSAMLSRIK